MVIARLGSSLLTALWRWTTSSPRLREAATKLTIYGSPAAHVTSIKGARSTDATLKVDKEFDYLIRVGRAGIATSGGAMKQAALREANKEYERKWGMTFDEFARQSKDGTLKEDAYFWNVEQDFWGWEQTVTLLNHYGSLAV